MTRWKYDAVQNDPLTALRIPVTSRWPDHGYLVVFDKDSTHRPTEAETQRIASFIEYVRQADYGKHEQTRMMACPFDIASGIHSVVLHKYKKDDWGYRRSNWVMGSAFTPPSPRVSSRRIGPMTLVEVMDLVRMVGFTPDRTWMEWKSTHPEVF